MAVMKSPGGNWMMMKAISEIANSMGTAHSRRRAIYSGKVKSAPWNSLENVPAAPWNAAGGKAGQFATYQDQGNISAGEYWEVSGWLGATLRRLAFLTP